MNVDVIFLREYGKHKQGDVVNVRAGFARNFLIPYGYALPATDYNKRVIEKTIQKKYEAINARILELKNILDAVSGKEVVFRLKKSGDRVFGSVTRNRVVKELKKLAPEFESQWLKLKHPLKEPGAYEIPVVVSQQNGISGSVVVKIEVI